VTYFYNFETRRISRREGLKLKTSNFARRLITGSTLRRFFFGPPHGFVGGLAILYYKSKMAPSAMLDFR